MNVTRMEHYVPRSYLRKFADRHERLFSFDKKELKTFSTNTKNVAQERDFYDLPPEVARSAGVEAKVFENAYARMVDSDLMKTAHLFLDHKPDDLLNATQRVHIAQLINFLHIRTRSTLDQFIEMIKSFYENIILSSHRTNFPDDDILEYMPTVEVIESLVNVCLSARAFDRDATYPVVMNIFSRKWELGLNNTELPLYTSDSPVVLQVIGSTTLGVGLITPNARIVLPITPKFAFRRFQSDEIRERLSESFRIKPPLSRVFPGNLLLN